MKAHYDGIIDMFTYFHEIGGDSSLPLAFYGCELHNVWPDTFGEFARDVGSTLWLKGSKSGRTFY